MLQSSPSVKTPPLSQLHKRSHAEGTQAGKTLTPGAVRVVPTENLNQISHKVQVELYIPLQHCTHSFIPCRCDKTERTSQGSVGARVSVRSSVAGHLSPAGAEKLLSW